MIFKRLSVLLAATMLVGVASASAGECRMHVLSASYGKNQWADVTDKVSALCELKGHACAIPVHNELFGDPDPGVAKVLKVQIAPTANTDWQTVENLIVEENNLLTLTCVEAGLTELYLDHRIGRLDR